MEEIWKNVTVEPHTLSHQVSNLGRIKSLSRAVPHSCGGVRIIKERILKDATTKCGYKQLQLSHRGKNLLVHRLVALAFIDNPFNKEHVNHINGIKTDNRLVNLEWLHPHENQSHAYTYGLQKGKALSGLDAVANNKPILMFNEFEEIRFESTALCARHIGGRHQSIYRVLSGERAHYMGCKFKRL